MPKHHEKKKQKKGAGATLIGEPGGFVRLLIKAPADQKFVISELVNEGPPHKQGLTALLMQRSYKLVKAMEKMSGRSFELQKGEPVHTETEEDEIVLPVELPIYLGGHADKKKIMELVSNAPIHEILAYTMCLQAIEWSIKTASLKSQ